MFYDGEDFLRLEHELQDLSWARRDSFTRNDASRHFKEGFCRRTDMLQTSRLHLMKATAPDRSNVSSPYVATEAAVHLNAYYLNLRGALDNLAWTLKWEFDLFEMVHEESSKGRGTIDLFNTQFQKALRRDHAGLARHIAEHSEWGNQIRKLRDPAAHRVPIYVPPGVFSSQEQVVEFRRLEALAALPSEERGGRSRGEILHEATSLAAPTSVAVMSGPNGLSVFGIGAQLGSDHANFLELSIRIVRQFRDPEYREEA